ncbi:hypothetical protein JCM8115_002867 [Rhodotorula mucilaginosa]
MDQLLRPTRHLLRSTGACSPRAPALARSLPPSFFPPRSPHANSNAACPTLRRCWPAARRTSISAFALRTFVTQPPKPATTARSNPSPATPADSAASSPPPAPPSLPPNGDKKEPRENIYTIPNALTAARIIACPAIGYYILKGDLATATGLLFVAGVSDLLDGWLARKYNMGTVLGSILDPAADKFLMTTMVVTLAMRDMLPLPLAIIILGRDVALSISAFYFRYASLPPPKTFKRYWDFSIPSASIHPTQISKYNTFLQLVLVGITTVAPLLPFDLSTPLLALQWIVAGTTIWSGLSYVGTGSASAIKYLK